MTSELEKIKSGLSNSVDKSNSLLLTAAVYFACHLLVKIGFTKQRSGEIQSESLEGKSVSYAKIAEEKTTQPRKGRDWYGMAQELISRYAESKIPANRGIGISVKNYRERIWRGIPNKYTD